MPRPSPPSCTTRPRAQARLLFVFPALNVGGAEQHAADLMRFLDPVRFHTSMVTINDTGRHFHALAAEGHDVHFLDHRRCHAPKTLRRLVGLMRAQRPDAVIMCGRNAEILGRLAAVAAGVRHRIIWVHNCGDVAPRGIARRLADRLLDPVTSAYFGVAHAQLPYMTGTLGYPAEKVTIVQNGIVPQVRRDGPARAARLARQLGVSPTAPVVGIVAALRPEKDHATFLRAARLVLDRHPDAVFLVVGGGPRLPVLQRLAVELGVAGSVVFTGVSPDVDALLRLMDVFVLTSRTVEAFPLALLEAMAACRPAVCTAVGGIPEIVEPGETGYLVEPGDAAGIAARVSELLDDPARAAALGRAGRRRVARNFTIRHSIQRAEQALVQILHAPAR